jgi:hypothetical protein
VAVDSALAAQSDTIVPAGFHFTSLRFTAIAQTLTVPANKERSPPTLYPPRSICSLSQYHLDMNTSTSADPHFSYLVQLGVLEATLAMSSSAKIRSNVLAAALVSKGTWEAYTRSNSVKLDFTNWTGTRIAGIIPLLLSTHRATRYALSYYEQVCSIEIHSDNQASDFGDLLPIGAEDAGRRQLAATLMRPVGSYNPIHHTAVSSAEEDVGFAYCQRRCVDGPVMVAALLCPNLVRLAVELSPNHDSDVDFSSLLARVFRADEALGITRWHCLRSMELTMTEGVTGLIVPRSVEELTIHNANSTSFTTVHPNASNHPSNYSQMRRLVVVSAGSAMPGEMATLVRTLIETGTLPLLACIQITECELHAGATRAFFDTCRAHIGGVLQEVMVDLLFREDDYHNVTGYNNTLQSLTALPSDILRELDVLVDVSLSRFLVSSLLELAPFLHPQMTRFCILGGFEEEIREIAVQEMIRPPASWHGELILGIDYNLPPGQTILGQADDADKALRAVQEGFERDSNARMNFLLRDIGSFQREIAYYFE